MTAPNTGGDRPEPLWATSLADQPRRDDEVVLPEPRRTEEAQPRLPAAAEAAGRRVVALGSLGAMVLALVTLAVAGRGSITVKEVPSSWEAVRMTCDTARLEHGGRALELFHCRAVGGGRLPPGLYRSPRANWTSDLTRRDAFANEIEISPDGELTGWAVY